MRNWKTEMLFAGVVCSFGVIGILVAQSSSGISLRSVLAARSGQVTRHDGDDDRDDRNHPSDIHKIKHIIIIMQENRSFDSYFGTYPGADGIPRNRKGEFTVCVPNPATGVCDKPFHNRNDENGGTAPAMPPPMSMAARWMASSLKRKLGRRAVSIQTIPHAPIRPCRM